jgi:hypothetical protein
LNLIDKIEKYEMHTKCGDKTLTYEYRNEKFEGDGMMS